VLGGCAAVVPAGGTTYGGYQLFSPAAVIPSPTLRIEARRVDGDVEFLTPTNVRVTGSFPLQVVQGNIENTSGETLTEIAVCGAAFNSSDKVVGVGQDFLEPAGGIAPGATVNFTAPVLTVEPATSAKAIASAY
jgi:hypothetical protein